MKKLEFLTGKWSGSALVSRGPGEPMRITQSEDVQLRLDGLVMVVEGTGRDAQGKRVFGALATIAYDDATSTYRFRAHSDGHFLDTELKVEGKGFSWGFAAGPLKVLNTMHVSQDGEWIEVTESTYGSTQPRRTVEMKLIHQK